MATQQPRRDGSAQRDQQENERQENAGNSKVQNTSVPNEQGESLSTAGDYALGKGSKTGVRKDEKEANDNYDHGRQA